MRQKEKALQTLWEIKKESQEETENVLQTQREMEEKNPNLQLSISVIIATEIPQTTGTNGVPQHKDQLWTFLPRTNHNNK